MLQNLKHTCAAMEACNDSISFESTTLDFVSVGFAFPLAFPGFD